MMIFVVLVDTLKFIIFCILSSILSAKVYSLNYYFIICCLLVCTYSSNCNMMLNEYWDLGGFSRIDICRYFNAKGNNKHYYLLFS